MKIIVVAILFLSIGATSLRVTIEDDELVDLSEIGLTLQLPSTWQPNGQLVKTTAADYHRHVYSKPYEKPDSLRVVAGFAGFAAFSVDSTLLPSANAYSSHEMRIEMFSYYGWYKRWLWSQGKSKFRESPEEYFEHRMSDLQGNPQYVWVEHEILGDSDPRKVIEGAFAIEYEWQPKASPIEVKGQQYYVVVGERCYRFQIEGSSLHFEENRPLYEDILRQLQYLE